MASVESRMNSYHLLSQILAFGVPGDIVEIGCHQGETTVVLQRVLQELAPERTLHAYDSFCGVPEVGNADEGVYRAGDMAVPLNRFLSNFDRLSLKRPIVHQGWFEETLPSRLPDRIAFAMIDGDLYESTHQSLKAVYPRLSPRAICLFGVYADPATKMVMTTNARYKSPGVAKACAEFLSDKPEKIDVLYAGDYTMGCFRKC
jgi:O-methyltransferase